MHGRQIGQSLAIFDAGREIGQSLAIFDARGSLLQFRIRIRIRISSRLEMTRRVLFEIIGNSSTVPIPEFQYCPDPVNEFSGRFPENSRAAREFSSGWRKSTDANSRAYARAHRARDRLSIRILHDSEKFSGGGK